MRFRAVRGWAVPVALVALAACTGGEPPPPGAPGATGPTTQAPAARTPAVSSAAVDVALLGNMPYGTAGRAALPAVVADVNAAGVDLTVFDGDFKSGLEQCSDEAYGRAIALFAQFTAPLHYVPGDNEWADCDRTAGGRYDPEERLQVLRRTFFAQPRSLGRAPQPVVQQRPAYPEHTRWRTGPITFVGLNVPRGNNAGDDPREAPLPGGVAAARAEASRRTAAALRWLADGFTAADAAGSRVVVVVWQANPRFGDESTALDPYAPFKAALLRHATSYAGQVVLVHGDGESQTHRVDFPLRRPDGTLVSNLRRVITFAHPDYHWVQLSVDRAGQVSVRPRLVQQQPGVGPRPTTR